MIFETNDGNICQLVECILHKLIRLNVTTTNDDIQVKENVTMIGTPVMQEQIEITICYLRAIKVIKCPINTIIFFL